MFKFNHRTVEAAREYLAEQGFVYVQQPVMGMAPYQKDGYHRNAWIQPPSPHDKKPVYTINFA